ncbi:hypothetical protein ACHAWO_000512 [Cyclotella atomus]|uniref:C3H1-type domain-containing protein n=1 Tax=Cyclotella atomus TaxID=382360 RepID=A0ABD3NEN3_9STRA
MKQAYTNTIRNGGGKPLTIATGSKKASSRAKAKQQVPKCAYGSACTRKGCAFRHPPAGTSYESYHEDPKSKICLPFLAGLCSYGNKCMNRHPGEEESAAVIAKYKQKVCSYGDSCQTEGCLYFHPYEAEIAAEEQAQAFTNDITAAVDKLDLTGTTETPSYEDWLAQSCPAPLHLDVNQVNNIWFYTSGMQRDPWEVYNLMYPQADAIHNAAPQTWDPLANVSSVEELSAMSQTWNPGASNVNSDPTSFEEWKQTGCHHPHWFQSDIDPWYDDEGVRRSLEEVYEVLYGENAQARWEEKEALRYKAETSADPTPAELLANGNQKQKDSVSLNRTTTTTSQSSGGWAKIASKPAAPQANNSSTNSNVQPTYSKDHGRKTVIMPKECWLPSTDNSNYFHSHPDPIERYQAINKQHESYLASVTIPTSLEGSNPTGKVTLMDVHFQSTKSIITVLDQFLPSALDQNSEVWIIAGLGTHIEAGHQKRGNLKTGGVLLNAVKKYLIDNEDDMGVEWKIGKEAIGAKYANGSFVVRKTR